MNTETLDFLIVGQGLAGSLLAWEIVNRGASAKVVDENWHASSSLVAAGLINPISGKRLVLQERAGFFLDRAESTYENLAQALGTPVFYPTPLLRLFRDREQQAYFQRRLQDPIYDDYWRREASAVRPFSRHPWRSWRSS